MKKIALFFFGLIVLVTIVSIVYILSSPSSHSFETSTEVNKSPKQCYAIFSNRDRLPDWIHDLSSVKLTKGKALEVGSEYELTFSAEGKEIKTTEIIKGYREGETFSYDFITPFMVGTESIEFIPTAGGTIIKTTKKYKGGNKIKDAMLRIMHSKLQKASEEAFINLGKLIEETP